MSADWIKMRSNLWDDPRVAALCDACDCGEAVAIGALYWLWAAADQHSEDGMLPGMTSRQIDRKTGVPGFAQAVEVIGWLELSAEGARIVRFEEHNGASAKRRSSESRRKMSARDADKARTEQGQAAPVMPSMSASDADIERTDRGSFAHLEKEKEKELDQEQDQERERQSAADAPDPSREPAAAEPKPRAKRESKPAITLRTFRAAGGLLVQVGEDPLLAYCDRIDLPEDFLRVAAHAFDQRYKATEQKQRDWPAHFRSAVYANWFKLWWDDGGTWRLTTQGKQAERELKALAAEAAA
jgi:hypothetical protein